MSYSIIATWAMAASGTKKAQELLQERSDAITALVAAVKDVEDNPDFTSVGFGGLPNLAGQVQLDAGFMDGKTLAVGGIAGSDKIKNPLLVATNLATEQFNNFLVGAGADEYALNHGFELQDNLTKNAKKAWVERTKLVEQTNISPYSGHDTVGVVVLDADKHLVVGTSTSGLFMKKPGRVGDSPMPGSGYYAVDGVGGAAATGMGEDIMKGALSFATVNNMAAGLTAQEAVQKAGSDFVSLFKKLNGRAPREISLVALDAAGNFGVYTNVDFYYCIADQDTPVTVHHVEPLANGTYKITVVTA